MFDLVSWKKEHCLDRMVAINISSLDVKENKGYDTAILLIKALPKEFVRQFSKDECDEKVFHELECPAKVLHGKTWTLHTGRDEIVDVYHCQTCLKCLAKCRYSQRYARI